MSKTITADDQMSRPIDSLIWATALLVRRALKWADVLEQYPEDNPEISELLTREHEMRQAYMVALKLRGKEVVKYAASIGVRCTADEVRENPFLIAIALQTYLENT